MKLEEYIKCHDVDFTKNLIDEEMLCVIENEIGVKFGSQLKKYLLSYGYLGYKSIEFYGINSRQSINSDMISQTLYLHKYFDATNELIALENLGEGQYALVDETDCVYIYISEIDALDNTNYKIEDYICKRFSEEDIVEEN